MNDNETYDLIASDKLEGLAVYDEEGETLGTVQTFIVDKASGQVEYVVLKFGAGTDGGADYYPLPWETLTYDADLGGYVVDIDKDELKRAPHYAGDAPVFDRDFSARVYDAYGLDFPA